MNPFSKDDSAVVRKQGHPWNGAMVKVTEPHSHGRLSIVEVQHGEERQRLALHHLQVMSSKDKSETKTKEEDNFVEAVVGVWSHIGLSARPIGYVRVRIPIVNDEESFVFEGWVHMEASKNRCKATTLPKHDPLESMHRVLTDVHEKNGKRSPKSRRGSIPELKINTTTKQEEEAQVDTTTKQDGDISPKPLSLCHRPSTASEKGFVFIRAVYTDPSLALDQQMDHSMAEQMLRLRSHELRMAFARLSKQRETIEEVLKEEEEEIKKNTTSSPRQASLPPGSGFYENIPAPETPPGIRSSSSVDAGDSPPGIAKRNRDRDDDDDDNYDRDALLKELKDSKSEVCTQSEELKRKDELLKRLEHSEVSAQSEENEKKMNELLKRLEESESYAQSEELKRRESEFNTSKVLAEFEELQNRKNETIQDLEESRETARRAYERAFCDRQRFEHEVSEFRDRLENKEDGALEIEQAREEVAQALLVSSHCTAQVADLKKEIEMSTHLEDDLVELRSELDRCRHDTQVEQEALHEVRETLARSHAARQRSDYIRDDTISKLRDEFETRLRAFKSENEALHQENRTLREALAQCREKFLQKQRDHDTELSAFRGRLIKLRVALKQYQENNTSSSPSPLSPLSSRDDVRSSPYDHYSHHHTSSPSSPHRTSPHTQQQQQQQYQPLTHHHTSSPSTHRTSPHTQQQQQQQQPLTHHHQSPQQSTTLPISSQTTLNKISSPSFQMYSKRHRSPQPIISRDSIDILEKLFCVFARYVLLNHDHSLVIMPKITDEHWEIFLSDCRINVNRQEAVLIFAQATSQSSRGQIGGMVEFSQFVRALVFIHDRVRSREDKDTFVMFLQNIVLPRARNMYRHDLNRFELSSEIAELRDTFETHLAPMFQYYAKKSSKDGKMHFEDWTQFCVDFDIVQIVSLSDLCWAMWQRLCSSIQFPIERGESKSIETLSKAYISLSKNRSISFRESFWDILMCVALSMCELRISSKMQTHSPKDLSNQIRALFLWMYLVMEGKQSVRSRRSVFDRREGSTSPRRRDLLIACKSFSLAFASDWESHDFVDYDLYRTLSIARQQRAREAEKAELLLKRRKKRLMLGGGVINRSRR